MNTFTFPIKSLPIDHADRVIEVTPGTEAPILTPLGTPVDLPWQHSTLRGYDASMRRHAEACEAGR